MAVLIELLATYAPYIYAACGLVALYQLYRLSQVRADRRQAVFSLERNRAMRSTLRGALKALRTAIDEGDLDAARAKFDKTVSLIDKMAGKGIIHDNAAARYKSRIRKRLTPPPAAG